MDNVTSILVIRRDNIGDLVCTTPLFSALRTTYRNAWIGVLANTYNAPVLEGNADLNEVYAYKKSKHAKHGGGALQSLTSRITQLVELRAKKLDIVVVASGAEDKRAARVARLLAPKHIVLSSTAAVGQHEVERTFTAARKLGIKDAIPPVHVTSRAGARERVGKAFETAGLGSFRHIIAMHISARRLSQRWPAEHFAQLAIELFARHGAATVLFWSPGPDNHPQHPGDDRKANDVIDRVAGKAPLIQWSTADLGDLIDGLAGCDVVVCSDGGAMHVAAGLGKPIVCLFGDSPIERWRPWGVPHVLLRPETGKVEDVLLETVLGAVAPFFEGHGLAA